ncbi:hypothetical protein [Lacisediminihabitans profunda]|uniref:Uncharacterized protein n=1 Tax=Lacisediminihabitans profunda TaxID=2594790 RepID=A0A5C8USZ6_9MICO|nr:hypothetical protein [Lacisediminihabitans profunda]TXN31377.1 hypothetical protein FVP33_07410 [Lacisediminihabitans profunda]
MSTESDLKNLFACAAATPARGIDTATVIRRSSRRRLGQQLALGSATTLAVAGIGVASVAGLRAVFQPPSTMSAGSGASDSGATAPEIATGAPGIQRAPAEKLNPCGRELAQVAPNPAGLVLTADFPAASASAESVPGTVTLTNTGSTRVRGTTAASPAITLSRDGITLWHSNGPMIAMAAVVDLEPGASMSYRATLVPVTCGIEDDSAGSFRTDLPHVAPGVYQVSAAIDLVTEGDPVTTDLVTGPLSSLRLK